MSNASRRPLVEVDGLNALKRNMRAAGVELQNLKDAHAEVAQIVVRAAQARVPHRTGRLAASLRGSGQAGAAVVRAGRASVPYANPIHWGWPARGIKPNRFYYDAIEASKGQWVGQYLHHLEKIIDSIEGVPGA